VSEKKKWHPMRDLVGSQWAFGFVAGTWTSIIGMLLGSGIGLLVWGRPNMSVSTTVLIVAAGCVAIVGVVASMVWEIRRWWRNERRTIPR
jgi:hypothetical protein